MAISTAVTWTPEGIADIFAVLADIDGNVITDSLDIAVNVYGGYVDDTASVPCTWAADSNGSSTWTPEG